MFLTQVAEVFGGKVVICIDELDKITDTKQLLELLKGIKGILGQERTHFMLTVSEDAVAYFTERLNSERNLVESSFEQIVYLDRISRSLAYEVVKESIGFQGRSPGSHFRRNCVLLWVFGGGIPREIKRNMVTIHSSGLDLTKASSIRVWARLYLEMVTAMQTSPPRYTSNEGQFSFLRGLEGLLGILENVKESSDFQQLIEDFSGVVTTWFKPLIGEKGRTKDQESIASADSRYLPLIAQIVIGFMALGAVAARSAREQRDHLDSLVYVSKYVTINPRYALFGLRKFLGDRLGYLYENTEETGKFEEVLAAV